MDKCSILPDLVCWSPNISVTWATPLSGYGHVADEQPLPFISMDGRELTPRFGGEEGDSETLHQTLPLPSGVLKSPLPLRDRLANLGKRRVNIYWRNVFHPFVKQDRYWFIEQLRFRRIEKGFVGESSLIRFERWVTVNRSRNEIVVSDIIQAKQEISFQDFHYAHCAEMKTNQENMKIRVVPDPIQETMISSSSGEGRLRYTAIDFLNLGKNQKLTSTVNYQFDNV
ncbi:hypothetical protein LG302_08890 [Halomonas organivorans]